MVLFLGAFKGETKAIKKACTPIDEYDYQGISLWMGSFNGRRVLVAETGTGKLNAAITATRLLEEYEIDAVVCIGIAGGLHPVLLAGDLFIAESIVQHDMDVRALGFKTGETPYADKSAFESDAALIRALDAWAGDSRHQLKHGAMGTGDVFIDKNYYDSHEEELKNIDACDMESYAIARVCADFDVPFISAKTISDLPGKGTGKSLREILPIAEKNSLFVLASIVNKT